MEGAGGFNAHWDTKEERASFDRGVEKDGVTQLIHVYLMFTSKNLILRMSFPHIIRSSCCNGPGVLSRD